MQAKSNYQIQLLFLLYSVCFLFLREHEEFITIDNKRINRVLTSKSETNFMKILTVAFRFSTSYEYDRKPT